jgi:quinol-cytochrome oxidoreductase complex cytochrome b subunit
MKYIIGLLIILGTAVIFTVVKWLDGKLVQKRTGKSSKELRNDKKWLIISFIGGLIIGLLYVTLFYI